MAFYHWADCPDEVRAQIENLISTLIGITPDLSGIYLHGSLAMGCFNPAHSDVDLLAVTQRKPPLGAVAPILYSILELSNKPVPIEISFVNKKDLHPWKHPAFYDIHYSEEWRETTSQRLEDNTWTQDYDNDKNDVDLAAHITITRRYGVCLWGEEIKTAFPNVPLTDYADAIISDVEWIGDRMFQSPIYSVLNPCRVLAFLRDGKVLSKAEGAHWAMQNLEVKWHEIIKKALYCYRSETTDLSFSKAEIKSFYDVMVEKIEREIPCAHYLPKDHA